MQATFFWIADIHSTSVLVVACVDRNTAGLRITGVFRTGIGIITRRRYMDTVPIGGTGVCRADIVVTTEFFGELTAFAGIALIIGAWVTVFTDDFRMFACT